MSNIWSFQKRGSVSFVRRSRNGIRRCENMIDSELYEIKEIKWSSYFVS